MDLITYIIYILYCNYMLRTFLEHQCRMIWARIKVPKFEQVKWANRSCSGPIGCRATGCFLAFEHVIRKPWLTATVWQWLSISQGQLNCSKPRCSIPRNFWLVFFRSAESSLPSHWNHAVAPSFRSSQDGALGATWVHHPSLRWSNRIKPQVF